MAGRITLIGCPKGGVGKSTFAVNLAASLAADGLRVCIVDTDVQGHASNWAVTRRKAFPRLPTVYIAQAAGRVQLPVSDAAQNYDHVIVDAGGSDSKELRSAMEVAHVMVSPYKTSQFDVWSMQDLAELVDIAREKNPPLQAMVVINQASTNWVSKRAARAREATAHFKQLLHFPDCVKRYDAFEDSLDDGRAVHELGRAGAKAADQFAAVVDAVRALNATPLTDLARRTTDAADQALHAN
jgi:chromosome partitioning protein